MVTRGRIYIAAAVMFVVVAAAALLGPGGFGLLSKKDKVIILGANEGTVTTPLPGSSIVTEAPTTTGPVVVQEGRPPGLRNPDGSPYGVLQFRSSIPVDEDLVFTLVIGSDARPGHDVRRSNGDSIHLLAVNPRTLQATIVGFPRDSWVTVPGKGQEKLTSALALGGPELMAETVRNLTGLPIHYWAITGFAGLPKIVDELGGVDIHVDRKMNDGFSGARFSPGWHHMNGAEVLAFSRNRHDTPNGDFSRSENHGKVILATLAKLRGEVGDDDGLRRWVSVLFKYASLDTSVDKAVQLAALARRLDPADVRNVVVPGRVGTAGKASVVYLDPEKAPALFEDLRADGVIGGPGAEKGTTTTSTTAPPPPETTTTTEGGWLLDP